MAGISLVGTLRPNGPLIDPSSQQINLGIRERLSIERHRWRLAAGDPLDEEARVGRAGHEGRGAVTPGEGQAMLGQRQPSALFPWAMTLVAVRHEDRLDVPNEIDGWCRAGSRRGIGLAIRQTLPHPPRGHKHGSPQQPGSERLEKPQVWEGDFWHQGTAEKRAMACGHRPDRRHGRAGVQGRIRPHVARRPHIRWHADGYNSRSLP